LKAVEKVLKGFVKNGGVTGTKTILSKQIIGRNLTKSKEIIPKAYVL
jgi:hypothetical protein